MMMWQPSRMVFFGLIVVIAGALLVGFIASQSSENSPSDSSINDSDTGDFLQPNPPIQADYEYEIWRGFECFAEFTGYRSDACPDERPNLHTGIDLLAEVGIPVVAVSGGTVIYAGPYTTDAQECESDQTAGVGAVMPQNDYGLQVIIEDGDYVYIYLHMSGLNTAEGTHYETGGDVIGYVGSRGCGGVPHLHFEVQYQGEPIDPMEHLSNLNAQ